MNSSHFFNLALSLLGAACLGTNASAAITYLGPTRYQSAADSPYAPEIAAGTVYLEDFEDRLLKQFCING